MAQLPPSLPHKKEVSMTSKRSNGEGTIYKNQSRNRFEGQVSVGINANGKSIRRKVTGRTRAEVTKKMSVHRLNQATLLKRYRERLGLLVLEVGRLTCFDIQRLR